VCGLNRPLLARGRVTARRTTVLVLAEWKHAREQGGPGLISEWTATVRDQPFADVLQAMFRQVHRPGADIVFAPQELALLRDRDIQKALKR
jgi:hypothetical protein